MTTDELDQIETTLGIRLPAVYRAMISTSLPLPEGFEGYVLNDVRPVIGINRDVRSGEFADEWNPQWFIIGNDACGNLYFIDLTESTSSVYLWDHETHETESLAQSLEAFRTQLVTEAEAS